MRGKPPTKKNRSPRIYIVLAKSILASLVLVPILILLVLRWAPLPTSSFMLQALASRQTIHYRWVPYRHISHHIPIAVVASEDQKFPHHWGFDFKAIRSVLEKKRQCKRIRGASTISQQVAKNLFLWSGRSYIRKGFEAYFTVMIELLWPKRRILEVYLNIAEFGPGIYGVDAASRAYFNKSAIRLRQREAALLAAVLPNPNKLKVDGSSAYVRERARKIEGQIMQLGGIVYLKKIWPKG